MLESSDVGDVAGQEEGDDDGIPHSELEEFS
jgi:hypothetical protein